LPGPRNFAGETALLGDIGSTNARFAYLRNCQIGPIETLPVAEFASIIEALRVFGNRRQSEGAVTRALLGVAGPIQNGAVTMTNSGWVVDSSELAREFGLERVDLMNDFAALAWSLPELSPEHLLPIGGLSPVATAPAVVLGAGTGLGLACLGGRDSRATVIETEGGHATLPGATAQEDAVIQCLRESFGHVSAERVLSGAGLVNLYHAIAAVEGGITPHRTATDITAAAVAGRCMASQATLDMFCAMLGTFAGNAALMFGARGGVFIGGGIVPRIADFVAASAFRSRFEAKGRFQFYLAAIPVYIITHPHPAFFGLRAIAQNADRPGRQSSHNSANGEIT
jgi:glucokinase